MKVRIIVAAVAFAPLLLLPAASAESSLERAQQLYQEKKWEEALVAFDALTKENPYRGYPWFRKARVLLILKRYRDAIDAYLESERLGYSPRWTAAGLAYCHMGLGNAEEATRWFLKSTTIDPEMMEELDSPGLRKFLGPEQSDSILGPEFDDGWSRVEGWRKDLHFFGEVIRRSHYDFDVKTSADVWKRQQRILYDRIPSLGDEEIALELAKLAALAGDGHTSIWPQFHDRLSFHMLPLLLYPFQDGIFVRAAAPEYADLIGARLVRIGGVGIEALAKGASAYNGHENPMHDLLLLPYVLGTVEILRQLGAAESTGGLRVTVADAEGKQTSRIVEPVPWASSSYGTKLSAPEWVNMNGGAVSSAPLWLRKPEDIYWFEYLEDERIIYFHYDQIRDKEDEPFAAFAERLFGLVEEHPEAALVIDLRMNDGGSSNLYPPLIKGILAHPEINREGRLFTIIGRMTYSAAMNLAVDLENWTETIFVGEPTGSSPNFIGENKFFTLPYSGLRVSVSDRYHQRAGSTDRRPWIAPDLIAEMTSVDYAKNADPALRAIVAYLKEHGEKRAGCAGPANPNGRQVTLGN